MKKKYLLVGLFLLTTVFLNPSFANDPAPKVSIIIDDLGNNLSRNLAAVNLPGPVVCSILPQTYYSHFIAIEAHEHHKEIIIHVPMQALKPYALGPGGLTENMSENNFIQALTKDYASVPYAEGMNNHMGSLLTQNATDMSWIMYFLKQHQLFFIDSRTINNSVAEKVAEENNIPTAARSVFLDDVATEPYVAQQFQVLIADAKKYGAAIAIGHPNAATLAYLQQAIPTLANEGVELVPLSQIVAGRNIKEYDAYYQNTPEQLQLAPITQAAPVARTSEANPLHIADTIENLLPEPVTVVSVGWISDVLCA